MACALEKNRFPQSGLMMAWDTMAVVMAGYESAGKDSAFVDITEYTQRAFKKKTWPSPERFGQVLQRQ